MHLSLLKTRPEDVDQFSKLLKSLCKDMASVVESIFLNSFVSSAKEAILECSTASGKSFAYNRNSMGPNIEPCGTPDRTGLAEDVAPSTVSSCDEIFVYTC